MRILILMALFMVSKVHAETTWIPIATGGNFIIVPFIPSSKFTSPDVNLSKSSSGMTISWDDILHASTYQVQVYDADKGWITLTETSSNSFTFPANSQYSHVRVMACNYTSCNDTGDWSSALTLQRQVIFIHTDLLGSPVAESRMQWLSLHQLQFLISVINLSI